jgi:hypothetical protein
MGLKKECKGCSEDFNPNNHKIKKGAAVATATYTGAKIGASYGWVGGPGSFGTGAVAGGAMLGGAALLGAKSITKCPNCGKKQLY